MPTIFVQRRRTLVVTATYNPTTLRFVCSDAALRQEAVEALATAANTLCTAWLTAAFRDRGDQLNAAGVGLRSAKVCSQEAHQAGGAGGEAALKARDVAAHDSDASDDDVARVAAAAKVAPRVLSAPLQVDEDAVVMSLLDEVYLTDLQQTALSVALLDAADALSWALLEAHACVAVSRVGTGDKAAELADSFFLERVVDEEEEAPEDVDAAMAKTAVLERDDFRLHPHCRSEDRGPGLRELMQRVEAGEVRPRQQDRYGRTPLHWVAAWAADLAAEGPELLRSTLLFLLEAGSPAQLCDRDGNTAVDLASRHSGAVAALQEFADDLDARGAADRTATELCEEHGLAGARRRRPLPPLRDILYEVPAPRCGQVAFSATRPHVFFFARGPHVFLRDLALERTLPLVLPGRDINPEAYKAATEEDEAHSSVFTVAFAVLPYHRHTHGNRHCDVLLLSDGHLLGVDHTQPDPVPVAVAVGLKFDTWGTGDGPGLAVMLHWCDPAPALDAGDDHDAATTLAAAQEALDLGPGSNTAKPLTGKASPVARSHRVTAALQEIEGNQRRRRKSPPQLPTDAEAPEEPWHEQEDPEFAFGTRLLLYPHSRAVAKTLPQPPEIVIPPPKTAAVLCTILDGVPCVLHIDEAVFALLHAGSSLGDRCRALGEAIDADMRWLRLGADTAVPEVDRYAQQRRLGEAYVGVYAAGCRSRVTSTTSFHDDVVAFGLEEGAWAVYGIKRRVFSTHRRPRPAIDATIASRAAKSKERCLPFAARDASVAACTVRTDSGSVAAWAGHWLYLDRVTVTDAGVKMAAVATLGDGELDSEVQYCWRAGFDPDGIYFYRRGQVCRADTATLEATALYSVPLTESELEARRTAGDTCEAASGPQLFAFNCDGSLLLRHGLLSQAAVVLAAGDLRRKVHQQKHSPLVPRQRVLCGPCVRRVLDRALSIPQERLCAFLSRHRSATGGSSQRRVDHCAYVRAALADDFHAVAAHTVGAPGQFTLSSTDGDGRTPLHIVAHSLSLGDLDVDDGVEAVAGFLCQGASLYAAARDKKLPLHAVVGSDAGEQLLLQGVQDQEEVMATPEHETWAWRHIRSVTKGVRHVGCGRDGRVFTVQHGALCVRAPGAPPTTLAALDRGTQQHGIRVLPRAEEHDALPEHMDLIVTSDGTVFVVGFPPGAPPEVATVRVPEWDTTVEGRAGHMALSPLLRSAPSADHGAAGVCHWQSPRSGETSEVRSCAVVLSADAVAAMATGRPHDVAALFTAAARAGSVDMAAVLRCPPGYDVQHITAETRPVGDTALVAAAVLLANATGDTILFAAIAATGQTLPLWRRVVPSDGFHKAAKVALRLHGQHVAVALLGPSVALGRVEVARLLTEESQALQDAAAVSGMPISMRCATVIPPGVPSEPEPTSALWVDHDPNGPALLVLREGMLLWCDFFARRFTLLLGKVPVTPGEHHRMVVDGDTLPSEPPALAGGASLLFPGPDGYVFRLNTVHRTLVAYAPTLVTTALAAPVGTLLDGAAPRNALVGGATRAYTRPPRTSLLKGCLAGLSSEAEAPEAQLQHLETVLRAVDRGTAYPTQPDADGRTPFHIFAAALPHMERDAAKALARRLLDAGCNPHLPNAQRQPAICSTALRALVTEIALEKGVLPSPAPRAAAPAMLASPRRMTGVRQAVWSAASDRVLYVLGHDGSLSSVSAPEGRVSELVPAGPSRLGHVALVVTACRDTAALEELRGRGNFGPEGTRPLADLTFDLATMAADLLLLSNGEAFAVTDPEDFQKVEPVAGPPVSWWPGPEPTTTLSDPSTAHPAATGVCFVWHETTHTAATHRVATAVTAACDGALHVRDLFPPPGISCIFPRHVPAMVAAAPPRRVEVPVLNAALDGQRAPPSVDTYGVHHAAGVGFFVTTGRYGDALLLFDVDFAAPLRTWSLAALLPRPRHGGYTAGGAARWSRPRLVSWAGAGRCLLATEDGLSVLRVATGIQTLAKERGTADVFGVAPEEQHDPSPQLELTLHCTATESSPVDFASVAWGVGGAAEHPHHRIAAFVRHGWLYSYGHADGRLVAAARIAPSSADIDALVPRPVGFGEAASAADERALLMATGEVHTVFSGDGRHFVCHGAHSGVLHLFSTAAVPSLGRQPLSATMRSAVARPAAQDGGRLAVLLSPAEWTSGMTTLRPAHAPWAFRCRRSAVLMAAVAWAAAPNGERPALGDADLALFDAMLRLAVDAVCGGYVAPNTTDAAGNTALHYAAAAAVLRRPNAASLWAALSAAGCATGAVAAGGAHGVTVTAQYIRDAAAGKQRLPPDVARPPPAEPCSHLGGQWLEVAEGSVSLDGQSHLVRAFVEVRCPEPAVVLSDAAVAVVRGDGTLGASPIAGAGGDIAGFDVGHCAWLSDGEGGAFVAFAAAIPPRNDSISSRLVLRRGQCQADDPGAAVVAALFDGVSPTAQAQQHAAWIGGAPGAVVVTAMAASAVGVVFVVAPAGGGGRRQLQFVAWAGAGVGPAVLLWDMDAGDGGAADVVACVTELGLDEEVLAAVVAVVGGVAVVFRPVVGVARWVPVLTTHTAGGAGAAVVSGVVVVASGAGVLCVDCATLRTGTRALQLPGPVTSLHAVHGGVVARSGAAVAELDTDALVATLS